MPTGAPGPSGPAAAPQLETRAGTGPARTPARNPAPPAPSRTRSAPLPERGAGEPERAARPPGPGPEALCAPPDAGQRGGARRASRSRDGGTAARAGGGSIESEERGRGKERGRGGRRAPGAGGPRGAGKSRRASGPAGLGAFPGGSDDSPGPPGLRAPNKGGSGGGALCAQVRPPSGHGGQRPRRTIPGRPARPDSRSPAPGAPRPAARPGPRPPGAPRFPGPWPRAPPHSQDRGLRRHGGHGLQQQMHAAHRGAEAQAAAGTPVARPGGDLGQRPPARAQNECQQAGARGAHGHDPRRAGRLGARTDSEGPARPPPAPDCARPPPRRGPRPSCAPRAGGASCAHARGSALPAPTSPRAGAGRGPPARSAAPGRPRLRRTGWAPGVQSQVRAHGLGPRLAAVATRVQ